MKRIFIILFSGCAMFSLASCSFLDMDPKVISPETFYESESDALYGLTGVYGAMNNEEFYGNYYSLMMSCVDDLCYCNRDVNGSFPYFYNHGTTDSNIYKAWTMIYAGVKNANEFMGMLEKQGGELDPDKVMYSEARFLRAYYHFILAQTWGNVPLRDAAAKSPGDVQMAASSQADVLAWCVKEMEECVPTLAASLENAPSRVTRSAAQGILARVYLFMAGESVDGFDSAAMYEKAAYWAKQVIDSGLHRLNPSYSDVFIDMIGDKYDTEYRESIWEVDFKGDRTTDWTNGRIGDLMGMQSSNNNDQNFSAWNCNYAYGFYNGSLKLWDLYWRTDRTDDENESEVEITDVRQEWNMAPYNYSGYTTGTYYAVCVAGYDKSPYIFDKKASLDYPTVAAGQRNASKWRREAIYEGHRDAKNLYTGINFPLLRYADVLLMYAEAVNEVSAANAGEAYDCVKQVRDRAGIATRAKSEYASQEAMRQLVRNERGRELCFEALRKYDLIRWGLFVDEMRKYTQWQSDARWIGQGMDKRAAVIGTNIQEKHIYQPIPATELGVNKLLKQNPMW
ncbi:MAG: RagB/SusD family nutrient uptake outer membrane protein [Alistipes senegalensis]|nr:RagB/SusD family nutrient uptake outer membrane protein [Bacteroides cellulosilyticus]MCM1352453.1 RagB/SusD family nutrient uptake outer membrane protein [Alistipes senegalensis]